MRVFRDVGLLVTGRWRRRTDAAGTRVVLFQSVSTAPAVRLLRPCRQPHALAAPHLAYSTAAKANVGGEHSSVAAATRELPCGVSLRGTQPTS